MLFAEVESFLAPSLSCATGADFERASGTSRGGRQVSFCGGANEIRSDDIHARSKLGGAFTLQHIDQCFPSYDRF